MIEMAANPQFATYNLIRVSLEDSYAANCIRVNERVLFAAGYPRTAAQLIANGFNPLPLDMSEFQKMDGGLSCLSLLNSLVAPASDPAPPPAQCRSSTPQYSSVKNNAPTEAGPPASTETHPESPGATIG